MQNKLRDPEACTNSEGTMPNKKPSKANKPSEPAKSTVLETDELEEHGTDYYRAGYTARQSHKIAGITYRMLDDWARHGPVQPSIGAEGSGTRRRYTYTDLLELKVVKMLRDAGVSLQKIKKVFKFVRTELKGRSEVSHIVIHDKDVYAVADGELINVLSKPGQGALSVLSLGHIKQELHKGIATQRPELVEPEDQAFDQQLQLGLGAD